MHVHDVNEWEPRFTVRRVFLPTRAVESFTVIGPDLLPVRLVDEYLAWLTDCERSPNTVEAYAHDLRAFWTFLTERGLSWDRVGVMELGEFAAWARRPAENVVVLAEESARLSARTVNRMLSGVVGFYEFQARRGSTLARDLVVKTRSGRGGHKPFLHGIARGCPRGRAVRLPERRSLPRTLSLAQVAAVIDCQERLRDRFLFALLASTGMRIGQALGLRHEDVVAWERRIVHVCDAGVSRRRAARGDRRVADASLAVLDADIHAPDRRGSPRRAGRPRRAREGGGSGGMSAEPLRVIDGGAAPRGWEALWQRDVWCQSELPHGDLVSTYRGEEFIHFERIGQPWLKEAAKRWARARLLAFTGFRVSSVVTLMRGCLELGSDGHPYVRCFNVNGSREAMLPIPPLLAEQLQRQQAFLTERFPDTEWLFPSRLHRGAKRGAFHISPSTVSFAIERYVRKAEIRTADGRLALDVHPHLLRHNVGTRLVNENVPLTVIQDVLDHGSIEMTARYARIREETVKRAVKRWHERVNIRGERIALPVDGPLEQAAWMKERIARAKQARPNGYCGLPLVQSCPHPNACLGCESFLTDGSFRAVHERHQGETRRLLEKARTNNSVRLIEVLERDEQSLGRILEGIDRIEADQAEDGVEELNLRDLAQGEVEGA